MVADGVYTEAEADAIRSRAKWLNGLQEEDLLLFLAAGSLNDSESPTPIPPLVAAFDWYPGGGSFASLRGPTPVHSRASAATMIDITGKVVYGPENTLLNSQEFDSIRWTLESGASVTPNVVSSPDGTLTADLLECPHTSGNRDVWQGFILPPGVYTFSIYLRSDTPGTWPLDLQTTAPNFLIANVTTAWKRFSITVTTTTEDLVSPCACNKQDGAPGHLASVYAWGAQLERSSVARKYIPTVSNAVYGPRITYDPVTHECLGYLAEEQRTNQALWSNDLSNVAWSKSDATLGNTISPDGSNNTWTITTVFGSSFVSQFGIGVTPSTVYSLSFWAKRGTMSAVKYSVYDLSNSADIVAPTDYYSQISSSEWTRVTVSFVAPSGCTSIAIYPTRNSGSVGTVNVYGFQLEAGPFPTSYIPTTTAPATRSADVCSITGADFSSFYNQSEGTIIVEAIPSNHDSYRYAFAITKDNADSGANEISVRIRPSYDVNVLVSSSSGTESSYFSMLDGSAFKAGTAFSNTVPATFAKDGVTVVAGAAHTLLPATTLSIGSQSEPTGFILNGTIARIAYYPVRLQDDKLIELTQ